MRIVVTGALGHIGSFLIRRIPQQMPGAEIVLVDNLVTQRYCSLFHLPQEAHYQMDQADVTKDDLSPLFQNSDAVVHLAAFTEPSESFAETSQGFEMNYIGTSRVAEQCAVLGVPLIFSSSTSVYDGQEGEMSESSESVALSPRTPYAQSKLREEAFLEGLGQEKGLRFTVLRFGTICGVSPGMRFHTAVNRFCFQAAMCQPITVWKTAMEQIRPYLDVQDAADAMITVIRQKLFDNGIYNTATEHRTVSSLLKTIQERIHDIDVEVTEAKVMVEGSFTVSCERFKEKGWVPRGSVDRCIGDTISLLNHTHV